jgi:hypothetical protein
MALCKANKKDGGPCPVKARASGYCWVHDPDLAGQRARGRRQGGQTRSKCMAVLPGQTPDAPLGSVTDVTGFLAQTINQVRKGQLDPKVANCCGYLVSVLLKAIEGGEMERRFAALEAKLEGE